MDKIELKPCPFCGEKDIGGVSEGKQFSHEQAKNIPYFFVDCPRCEGMGGGKPTIRQAIIAWNMRINEQCFDFVGEDAISFEANPKLQLCNCVDRASETCYIEGKYKRCFWCHGIKGA